MANSAGTMPNTGRWGWYKDHEGREWRRVSTLIKKVDTNTSALDAWKKRQVLLGAARRDDIILGVKALGAPDPVLGWNEPTKKKLNAWAEDCMSAAGSSAGATEGTAMHDLTERVDRGEPIDQVAAGLPGPAAASLRAYAKLRELNGWRSVEIERTVVCDELEVAGSFDRIDIIPGLAKLIGAGACQHGHDHREMQWDGEELAVIVDVKTEKDPLLNGLHIGPQLAIYSRARRMWLPEGPNGIGPEYDYAPCVRQDVAIVVHVRDGKAIPYFVDLTAGWEAAQAAARQLQREKEAKKWFAPVPGVVEPKPAEVLTDVAVAAQYADPGRPMDAEKAEAIAPGASDTEIRLATAMLDASRVTATVLGPAPMPNLASVQRMAETLERATLDLTSGPSGADTLWFGHPDHPGRGGLPLAIDSAREQVAERGADGLVRWSETAATLHMPAALQGLLNDIERAQSIAELGKLWELAQRQGIPWEGPVAAAGEARRRIIECPQRALHTSGKCSCGWVDG